MKLAFIVLVLLTDRTFFCQGQKKDKAEQNEAEMGQSGYKLQICDFKRQNGEPSLKVAYNQSLFACVECKRHRTLAAKKMPPASVCRRGCGGALCNNQCMKAEELKKYENGEMCSIMGRRVSGGISGYRPPSDKDAGQLTGSQVPLIIGFTVGGILLAIVVAGIFLGRHQRADDGDGSEVVTTPVSLSNSEWHSNGGSGSSRRREENLRVQEASTEDLTAVPLYTIHGYKQEYHKDENCNDYLMSAREDASSIGQDSYRSSEIPSYYPPQLFDYPSRSNRSSDVILEDGYVTGGNFVGSSDPQVRKLLDQNSHTSPNMQEDQQTFFNGQTPGSMTHDAICMSLTHSANNYGEVEYVIEDQDLVAFDTTPAYSKKDRTPPINGGMRISQTSEDDTLQISLHYGDADSDFEDHESRPGSAVKPDKSDVFLSPDTQSPDRGKEMSSPSDHDDRERTESQCSESGIEVSCHSKDSCDIGLSEGGMHGQSILPTSVSWNENCKGRSSERLLNKKYEKHDRFFPAATNRSKSCIWKSPNAPIHSFSRKQSVPIHCPSSAPAHSRPRPGNLTHVFVDVHRDMASSDEDLLSQSPARRQSHRNPSFSDSDSSSFSEIPLSALQRTPKRIPLDMLSPVPDDPTSQVTPKQRNKSMYVLRNGSAKGARDWAPRTVRFSSSGSGEYAIPFGSLVP